MASYDKDETALASSRVPDNVSSNSLLIRTIACLASIAAFGGCDRPPSHADVVTLSSLRSDIESAERIEVTLQKHDAQLGCAVCLRLMIARSFAS